MSKPFSRARPRGGPPLTGLLEAGNILAIDAETTPREHRRTVSEGTEPPLSIPRQWGRRARPRAEFNRRNTERPAREQDEDTVLRHQTRYTGDSDPEEFNMESILMSTPANINRRDRPIDMLMSADNEVDIEDDIGFRDTRPAEVVNPEPSPPLEIPRRHRKETKSVTFQSRQERHQREDSRTLLRKLARGLSTSPSPKAEYKEPDVARQERIPVAAKEVFQKSKSLRDPRRVISEPPHPKSALEAIVNEAKENHDPQYGENTIASLEDIIHPNLESTISTLNNTPEAAPKREERVYRPSRLAEAMGADDSPDKNRRTEDLRQAEDRRQEDLTLEALNKRLTTAHSTLTDANRGLRRIENRIEGVDGDDAKERKPAGADKTGTKSVLSQKTATKGAQSASAAIPVSAPSATVVQGVHVCARCGGHSLWRGLWGEFLGNFYTHSEGRGYRFTWLGWLLLLWLLWLTAELSLHDVYADYMYGPIFPFVAFNVTVRTVLSLFGKGW